MDPAHANRLMGSLTWRLLLDDTPLSDIPLDRSWVTRTLRVELLMSNRDNELAYRDIVRRAALRGDESLPSLVRGSPYMTDALSVTT